MITVKLARRVGQHQAGSVVSYDDSSARFLIARGHATEVRTARPSSPRKSAPEPEPEPDDVAPPPQAGKGSGRAVWADYARHHGVEVSGDDTRDDIIDACADAGVPIE